MFIIREKRVTHDREIQNIPFYKIIFELYFAQIQLSHMHINTCEYNFFFASILH
jgi:hypothetical protein